MCSIEVIFIDISILRWRLARNNHLRPKPDKIVGQIESGLTDVCCISWHLGYAISRQSYLVKASARGPKGGPMAPFEKPCRDSDLSRWAVKKQPVSNEISDFTPCAHAQSNILHIKYAEKTGLRCVGLEKENNWCLRLSRIFFMGCSYSRTVACCGDLASNQ